MLEILIIGGTGLGIIWMMMNRETVKKKAPDTGTDKVLNYVDKTLQWLGDTIERLDNFFGTSIPEFFGAVGYHTLKAHSRMADLFFYTMTNNPPPAPHGLVTMLDIWNSRKGQRLHAFKKSIRPAFERLANEFPQQLGAERYGVVHKNLVKTLSNREKYKPVIRELVGEWTVNNVSYVPYNKGEYYTCINAKVKPAHWTGGGGVYFHTVIPRHTYLYVRGFGVDEYGRITSIHEFRFDDMDDESKANVVTAFICVDPRVTFQGYSWAASYKGGKPWGED